MQNKEFSAWSLIVVAVLSGSLTASSIAGCKPKSTSREMRRVSLMTAGVESTWWVFPISSRPLDPALSRRSMELLATEVMPRVNSAIGTSVAAQ